MVTYIVYSSQWVSCLCCYKATSVTHLKNHSSFFYPTVLTVKRVRGERETCVYNCVLGITSTAMCPWQTEEEWYTHHSSTTGISINILQCGHSAWRAVEQWRHVSHCLVCLQVGFRECSALHAPGGETWVCLTRISSSTMMQAELCFLTWIHSNQANQSKPNMTVLGHSEDYFAGLLNLAEMEALILSAILGGILLQLNTIKQHSVCEYSGYTI